MTHSHKIMNKVIVTSMFIELLLYTNYYTEKYV